MRVSKLKTGKIGEDIAKKYLLQKGYKILEENVLSKFGEIDIVAQDKKILVIVEVRTRIGDSYGTPEESLGKKKLEKLKFNTMCYLAKIRWEKDYRIDAVCITLCNKHSIKSINHHIAI